MWQEEAGRQDEELWVETAAGNQIHQESIAREETTVPQERSTTPTGEPRQRQRVTEEEEPMVYERSVTPRRRTEE